MAKVSNDSFGVGGFDTFVRKFARNVGLANDQEAVMWDGDSAYDGWLEAEEDVEWSSSSAEDAPGGTGCQYIQFTGQGANGIEKTYSGQLNGLSWTKLSDVDAGVLFDIIYTAQCYNVEGYAGNGSLKPMLSEGSANIGVVTIRSVTTQKTMAQIRIGRGRTQMMLWRCPADHYAKFVKFDLYPSDNQPFVGKLMGRASKELSWICVGELDSDDFELNITHPLPDYVGPGYDLCLVVTAGSGGANCSSQMWIEKLPIPNYTRLVEEGQI